MHTVDIGIGSDYNIAVADIVDSLLDVECGLQKVELVVLVNHLFGLAVRVERLTAQTEDCLSGNIAALGD